MHGRLYSELTDSGGGVMGRLRGAVLLLGCAAVGCATAPGPRCGPDGALSPAGLQASLEALGRFLDGFHEYADQEGTPVRARHVCSRVNADLHACIVYDRRGGDDDLIGVELIVSARLFQELPPDERAFWHAHRTPAVDARIAADEEGPASTYGRIWYPEDLEPADVDSLSAR